MNEKELLYDVANFVENYMDGNKGFIFILCNMNEQKRVSYISNCQRKNVIDGLREMADALEKEEYTDI